MFGIGMLELVLILVLATIVLGPEKMVEFSGQMARLLAKFRTETEGITQEFRDAFDLELDGSKASGGDTTSRVTPGLGPAVLPNPKAAKAGPSEPAVAEQAPAGVADVVEQSTEAVAVAAVAEEESVRDDSPDAEAVAISVGELVPEDVDVEPQLIAGPVLVEDEQEEAQAPQASLESETETVEDLAVLDVEEEVVAESEGQEQR